MFGNDALAGFTYKGYTYRYDLDYEDDNCKTNHYADRGEKRVTMDWSPYSNPTKAEFMRWIDLGMPSRQGIAPLCGSDLLGYETALASLKVHGISPFGHNQYYPEGRDFNRFEIIMMQMKRATPQYQLIVLCQDENEAAWLRMIVHPTGMRHQFSGMPLTMMDFAWASTMYESFAETALPIVQKALEEAKAARR